MAGLYTPRPGAGGAFYNMGQRHSEAAIGAHGRLDKKRKTEYDKPGKTVGEGMMTGAGMGLAGYQIGTMVGGGGTAAATAAGAGAGLTGLGAPTSLIGAGSALGGGAAGGAAGAAATGAGGGLGFGPAGALIGTGVGILAYLLS